MNEKTNDCRIVSNYSTSNAVWQTRIDSSNKTIDPTENSYTDKKYNIQVDKYIHHALKNRPELPGERVSDFTDWIYLLDGKPRLMERLRAGSQAEARIFNQRLKHYLADSIPIEPPSEWELFHCGMQVDANINYCNFYEIPSLRINGNAIRGSPDLVFLNHSIKKAIIVEIKHSRAVVSSNLWPNVWAQLWAYAHIPIIQSMQDITLIGEVWGEEGSPPYRSSLESEIFLRASVHRDARKPSFDRFFRSLFNIYAGND